MTDFIDSDDYEPIVLLNDEENFTALRGSRLIVLTQDEAERAADDDALARIRGELEVQTRTYDLEAIVPAPGPKTKRAVERPTALGNSPKMHAFQGSAPNTTR